MDPRLREDDEGRRMDDPKLTDTDRAIGFAIPGRSARGRLVRLGPTLTRVLAAHAYPPAIERLLAEALTLVALIGSTLKDPQAQLTPTLVRVGISRAADGTTVAGGLFLQHLPEGEDGRERLHTRLDHPEWAHIEALGVTVEPGELADAQLPLEHLLWRLFNEDE